MNKIFEFFKNESILKSLIGITGITFIIKILGYFEKILLAYYFGTGYEVDVCNTVFSLVLAVFLFTRELIEPGFLNVFLKSINKNENEAWKIFNLFLRIILIFTFLLSLFGVLFPEILIDIFAPGFQNKKRELAIELIQISFPAIIFYSLSALTNITLNSFKKFIFPSLGDFALKSFLLIALLVFANQYGIKSTSIGILLGCIARFLVHLIDLFKHITFKKLTIEKENYSEIWKLTWPLFIGVFFSQFITLFDNILFSKLEDGTLSAITYAKKIIEFPILIFPYVLSVVLFPYLTDSASKNNQNQSNMLFTNSFQAILVVFIPIAIFFYFESYSIIELIYKRGAFNLESTLFTAQAFKFLSLGMIFMALETILVIFFYANGDTKTPVFLGIFCVILNIIITLLTIKHFGYISIVLGTVISKIVKDSTLIVILSLKKKLDITFNKCFKLIGYVFLIIIIQFFISNYFKEYLHFSNVVYLAISSFILFGISLVTSHYLSLVSIRKIFTLK